MLMCVGGLLGQETLGTRSFLVRLILVLLNVELRTWTVWHVIFLQLVSLSLAEVTCKSTVLYLYPFLYLAAAKISEYIH